MPNASSAMENILNLMRRDDLLSQENDPNIGSARGTSTDAFVSTLVINLAIFAGITILFFLFRRHNRRIYAPLTCVPGIESWRKLSYSGKSRWGVVDTIESLPGFSRPFGWIWNVWKLPDETVLRTNGLDGYLFLRYIRISMILCFVGIVVTCMLLPINSTGGGAQTGLDRLSFSNIGDKAHKRLYVHVVVSYIYFGIILFAIYRELLFYIAIRQAYMHSDIYASRLSSRTLLVTQVPRRYRNEEALKSAFGSNVEHVWVNRCSRKLNSLVKRRDEVAMKLEAAEVALVIRTERQRKRAIRRGVIGAAEAKFESNGTDEPEKGNAFSRWYNTVKRPTHRVAWGKKVDTIEWCRSTLETLNPKVSRQQEQQKAGETGKLCNSAFIAFDSQSSAQYALRLVIHDLTIQMAPRYIGVSPAEVIWENLNVGFFERQVRVVIATAAYALMTLFWSVPNALVGTISQLDYLAEKIPFLNVINLLPNFIVGVITGLIPPLLLSLLLELVPTILTWLITFSGEPAQPNVQLKIQRWYFTFLVIQVFLVTTITSAASAAATQIIENPTSIPSLLAESLPKASNFYISYMLLQGLSVSASIVLQFAQLVLYKILSWLFDDTPRKRWQRWSNVADPGIGTLFPFYSNLVVISLTYSVIAPLVLVFATTGLCLVYFAYRYNFLFVYNATVDTKGLAYPRAWHQTLLGVYLCQGCMTGLFALKAQLGPAVLQVVLLAATVAFQQGLTKNITTLLDHLPDIPTPSAPTAPATPSSDIRKSPLGSLSSFSKTSTIAAEAGVMGVLHRFLRPELFLDHRVVEKLVPRLQGVERGIVVAGGYEDVYRHPAVTSAPAVIWVPRDAAGVAEREIERLRDVIPGSCEGIEVGEVRSGEWWDTVVPPDWEAGVLGQT